MDARGAEATRARRRRCGAGAGLRPAQAAHVDHAAPAARPRCRARTRSRTSCGCSAHAPDVARATWKYLEPKDWLNLKLTGRCAATYDSIVLHWVTDNRDPRRIDYDPELLRLARPRPRAAARPRRARPIGARRRSPSGAAEELGVPAGIPVVGGTPDLQSAAIGSGAVRDFEGHLYVGTSSWLTCHVPFKKTDIFHGIASLPSPLPGQVLRRRRAGGRGRLPRTGCATTRCETGDDASTVLDAIAADGAAPGSNGVIFTPWLNGERTPVDDHTFRARLAQPLAADDPRRARARRCSKASRTTAAGCSRRSRSSPGARSRGCNFIGGGAQSELWCQIMADVLDRDDPPGRAPDPRQRPRRGAARRHSRSAGSTSTTRAHVFAIVETFMPDRANACGLRRAVPRVPRDAQADSEGHLRARLHADLIERNSVGDDRSRCAAGACPSRASSTGSSSCRRISTTRCSAAALHGRASGRRRS